MDPICGHGGESIVAALGRRQRGRSRSAPRLGHCGPVEPAVSMNAPETVAAIRLTPPVHGMSCASCVAHVEKALAAEPGSS
jgi:hypothetical protein